MAFGVDHTAVNVDGDGFEFAPINQQRAEPAGKRFGSAKWGSAIIKNEKPFISDQAIAIKGKQGRNFLGVNYFFQS